MRILFTFMCVLALGLMGCSETSGTGGNGGVGGDGGGDGGDGGTGGSVTEAIEEMMVGRWWLDWDKSAADTADGIALPTFTADGWANYDVRFPTIPELTEWCRRYADWSLFDVVSETEFGYALTYTHDTCNRETDWTEQFKVVLDQTDPPKGEVTRLFSVEHPAIGFEWTLPIERCTTDINATEACGFETGLGPPTQNPGGGGAGGAGGEGGSAGIGGGGGGGV
jgi:hypothetical protein